MIQAAQTSSNTQSEGTIRATSETADTNAARQVRERFKRPWIALLLIFLAGLVCFFPTLQSPFLLDDYLQAAMVDGVFPCKRGIFDLYDFVNEPDRAVLAERGLLTWWSDPHLQIRFFRPLASALRWGEHLVLGRNAMLLHIHSFLWWFVAVLGAHSLYKKALSPRATWIATVAFALAPCHVMPLAWLANREVFMSLAFGAFALHTYVHFRETRRLTQGLLAFVLFTLAMFSGEYALCFAGFVLAVEIGQRESLLRRTLGLVPFVIPTIGYMSLRALLGYGTRGSGYYTDPLRDPLPFLSTAPRRFITLLATEWMSFDYDTVDANSPVWTIVLLAMVGVPMIVLTLRRLYRELNAAHQRWFLIFGIGSLLALPPVMAVSPTPRVLGASVLGMAPIVAMLLERGWFVAEQRADRGAAAQLCWWVTLLLGFAHLVHAPGAAWLSAGRIRDHAMEFVQHADALRAQLNASNKSDYVVLRAVINSFYMPFVLDPQGRLPAHWRILSQTQHALVLRQGPRTLEILVRPEDRIYSSGPDHLYRQDASGMKVGDVATMPGVRATIVELGVAGPRRVRFDFDEDLDASTLTWLAEHRDGFTVEKPQPIGFGKPFSL